MKVWICLFHANVWKDEHFGFTFPNVIYLVTTQTVCCAFIIGLHIRNFYQQPDNIADMLWGAKLPLKHNIAEEDNPSLSQYFHFFFIHLEDLRYK